MSVDRQDDVDPVRLGGGDEGVEEARFVVHRIGYATATAQ